MLHCPVCDELVDVFIRRSLRGELRVSYSCGHLKQFRTADNAASFMQSTHGMEETWDSSIFTAVAFRSAPILHDAAWYDDYVEDDAKQKGSNDFPSSGCNEVVQTTALSCNVGQPAIIGIPP